MFYQPYVAICLQQSPSNSALSSKLSLLVIFSLEMYPKLFIKLFGKFFGSFVIFVSNGHVLNYCRCDIFLKLGSCN